MITNHTVSNNYTLSCDRKGKKKQLAEFYALEAYSVGQKVSHNDVVPFLEIEVKFCTFITCSKTLQCQMAFYYLSSTTTKLLDVFL